MGMECSIKLTVKLNSGRMLVNECVCLWCKRWDIADLVCDIVGVKNDYEYHLFKLKNGELKELRDRLLSMCEEDNVLEDENFPAEMIDGTYARAAELTKIMLMRAKKLPVYELFPKELENNYDPDDNVIETKVEFEYSP